ncbi:o-antigen ligase-related [Desulfoluna butyratoxydans]|uniref:O-antigen ligase-related n=1 Tax=Desulfoluna butyratoxydans TaxID=231438 RepID=A0A4U8YU14_9BACT|nr:o-antigen ligase-related [Desulfoluna butyratoxydans]
MLLFSFLTGRNLCGIGNHDVGAVAFILYFSLILFSRNLRVYYNRAAVYYFVFAMLAMMSLLYAHDVSLGQIVLLRMAIVFVTFMAIYQYIKTEERLITFLTVYLLAALCYSVVLWVTTDFSHSFRWFNQQSYNTIATNFFGVLVATLMLLSMKKKNVLYPVVLYLIVLILSTASVKVNLAMALFGGISFSYKFAKSSNLSRIMFLVIFVVILGSLYFVISKYDVFDRHINRIASTVNSMIIDKKLPGAAGYEFRYMLWDSGVRYWLDSPLWGHGVNNFRYLFEIENGYQTYSHNTLIELLVGLGLFGSFVFSMIIFYSLKANLCVYKLNRSIREIYLFAGLVCFTLVGFGQQIYYSNQFFIFLGWSFAYFKISRTPRVFFV